MVAHDHRERVAGCFRCALSADEVSMVEQLRQLEQAATPGPWGAADGGSFGGWWLSINGDPSNRTLAAVPEGYLPDAELIAAARNCLPALLDIAEAAQEYVDFKGWAPLAEDLRCESCDAHVDTDDHTSACRYDALRAALARLDTEGGT